MSGTGSPPDAERRARLDAVRAGMGRRSMAALIVSDPANIYYLSGYNAWSFYTPQCLVVPAAGPPVLFARAMDAAGADRTTWLPTEDIEGYPERLVHRADAHPYQWIAGRIAERGLASAGATVGVEGDAHYFSVRGYLALVDALPGVRFEESRELVNWVRLVKSDWELDRMRTAGKIAQQAMTVALQAVRVGRRQCDVVAEIVAAQASGLAQAGGDYPAIVPMLPTGAGAGTPHLTWTDEPLRAGEATTIEIAGVYQRYHCPIARTVMVGVPPARLASTASVVADGMAAVLSALRPGVVVSDVHRVWDEVISAAGLSKASRIGYSIGIGYPPDWGERTVSLRGEETTELGVGMCFHVILGMWMDGWGYELSEPVIIGGDGAVRLTDLTQGLTVAAAG